MMTLFARGGSLAALAAMLALASPAVPAAAQEMLQVQPDEPVAAPERPERVEISGGPAQVEFPRTERGAPRFADIAEDLLARLNGRLFVAHNARFDHGFLKAEFRRVGLDLRVPVLCSVEPRHLAASRPSACFPLVPY